MITAEKIPNETFAFWTVLLLAVLLISNYGRQIINGVLSILFELFIGGKNPVTPGS
jgi:hypothetical protein